MRGVMIRRGIICVFIAGLGAVAIAGGCGRASVRAEAQIRERIASIRDAILAKQPEGIVRWGTDDWTFTGADGRSFDKTAYLERTRALMERIVSVDSLDTHVDTIEVRGQTADVEITQTMERHEKDAKTGDVVHLRLRYRERHEWALAADGWRVRRVTFIGTPERTVLTGSPR